MKIRRIPEKLSEKRRRQWQVALQILNEVIDVEGFQSATVEAVEADTLYQMSVKQQDGDTIVVDGPERDLAVKELDGWFGCQVNVEFNGISLPSLQDWMSTWGTADLAFLPEMLLDESENCRSHQASDSIEFTFIWTP